MYATPKKGVGSWGGVVDLKCRRVCRRLAKKRRMQMDHLWSIVLHQDRDRDHSVCSKMTMQNCCLFLKNFQVEDLVITVQDQPSYP